MALFVRVGGKRRAEFVLEHGEPTLKILEIERAGRFRERQCFSRLFGGVFEPLGHRWMRGAMFLRRIAETRCIALDVLFHFLPRKRLRSRSRTLDLGAGADCGFARPLQRHREPRRRNRRGSSAGVRLRRDASGPNFQRRDRFLSARLREGFPLSARFRRSPNREARREDARRVFARNIPQSP